jgi:multidrug resistance efflux pump
MLDIIAGAMAAFLILMVILLPYYERETVDQEALIAELRQDLAAARAAQSAAEGAAQAAQARMMQAQAALAAAQAQVSQAQAEAARQEARAEGLARQLAKSFLVLYVRWDTHDDVDLVGWSQDHPRPAGGAERGQYPRPR